MINLNNKNTAIFLRPEAHKKGITNLFDTSVSASSRLQLEPAGRACQSLGMTPFSLSLLTSNPEHMALIKKPKICITGKLTTKGTLQRNHLAMAQLAAIAILKADQVPILATYCDHQEEREESIRELHKDLLRMADTIVFPSLAMKEKAHTWLGDLPRNQVIEDPWQTCEFSFQTKKTRNIRIIWFGHESNLPYLRPILPKISSAIPKNRTATITILTSLFGLRYFREEIDQMKNNLRVKIRPIVWDQQNPTIQLEKELGNAQFCIIPSDTRDNNKNGASHNRLVDAIRCGCISIASPIQSYKELEKLTLLSTDFPRSLALAIHQQDRLANKYNSNRGSILSRFAPQRNLDNWINCINDTINHALQEH
ncbi:glycosyltransferase family 47 protein [Synechococcus sp. AH-551-A10]|nr:hypothetical protein [Synechococcus sp. AH-551-A10]MDB4682092.1 glycosyltransferase family 47 protein [Synechococcus sp. AH-551-A10]